MKQRLYSTILSFLFFGAAAFAGNNKIPVDTTKPVYTILNNSKSGPLDSNILIVVNGTVAGTIRELKKDISALYPDELIQSINVYKGDKATEKFGERGKAGAIEFIFKNAEVRKNGSAISETDTVKVNECQTTGIEGSFPGGDKAWRYFLERTVNATVASENGSPDGTYTTIVQFTVNPDGTIGDIKPFTNHGYGMEEEVIRVIKKSPGWQPAVCNGKVVRSYRKQPVTFSVVSDIHLSTNVLQAGKETVIEIEVYDYLGKGESFEISLSEGSIRFLSGNKYIVRADNPGKITLTVRKKQKKKTEEIAKRILEVK